MRLDVRRGRFLFLSLLLACFVTACDGEPGRVSIVDPGDGDEESLPTEVPGKVMAFDVAAGESRAELKWKPAEHAAGYRLYRGEGEAEPRLLVEIVRNTYRDIDVLPGTEYTYSVAAFNHLGEGERSDEAGVLIEGPPPPPDLYEGWLAAPYNPPATPEPPEYPDEPTVPVVIGGNVGSTSATTFAADAVSSCTQTGIRPVALRPDPNEPLPVTAQTFSLSFAYNVGSTGVIEYSLIGMGSAYGYREHWYSWMTVESGCGVTTATFTVDTSALAPGEQLLLRAYVGYYASYTYHFVTQEGPWMAVRSSIPVAGGALDGASPLSLELDYNNLAEGVYRFGVKPADGFSLGSTGVSLAGTGTTIVEIDYEAGCLDQPAKLTTYGPEGWLKVFDLPQYYFSSDPPILIGMDDYEQLSLSTMTSSISDIDLESCDKETYAEGVTTYEKPVTVAASPGFLIFRSEMGLDVTLSTSATGTTAGDWRLLFDRDLINDFGDYPVTVTISVEGMDIERNATLSVYGVYWDSLPPDNPVAGVTYPVSVTFMNPPAGISGRAEIYNWSSPTKRFDFVDGVGSYSAQVTFPTCGQNRLSARFGNEEGNLYVPYLYFDVDAGAEPSYSADIYAVHFSSSLYYPDVESFGLYDECSYLPAEWTVVSAPPWVRFTALSGSSDTPVEAIFYRPAADETTSSGSIYLEVGPEKQLVQVYVHVW